MSWSLGEIQALTIKAARGAGYPWGVADEAGWAVRWLSSFGLPGAESMARSFDAFGTKTCPLTLGVAIADSHQSQLLANDVQVTEPMILLPFLGRIAGPEQMVQVLMDNHVIHVTSAKTDLRANVARSLPSNAKVTVEAIPDTLPETPRQYRVDAISDETLRIMQRFANRTYAPATEASRNSGAGAGLTDND